MNLVEFRHPSYGCQDWEKWRYTYEGGTAFRDQYLEQFSTREDAKDFALRRNITPIPAFARSAINDVRNAIYQRMQDISRQGGSAAYQQAMKGMNLGVDRRGSTMNAFIGVKVLTELLVMGRVGVFVDAPPVATNATLADVSDTTPYLYKYDIEDILSWTCSRPEEPSEFQALLLQDHVMQFDASTFLPTVAMTRYRYLWIENGHVNLQYYNEKKEKVDQAGQPAGPVELELTRIPFVLLDIGGSMIQDVCQQQIALLNLGSSDVNYALRANFPFYIEQKDPHASGSHLKPVATEDGTATSGGQGAADRNVPVGVTHGRYYDKGMNPPDFINPSSEPLEASLKLQEKLKRDIRELVNLAVSSLAVRASAESKAMDNQGLEAGLSYIGELLEGAERQVAGFWAAYENRAIHQRQVATVKYPDRYSLKTDNERMDEAEKAVALMAKLPGRKVKQELAKSIIQTIFGGKLNVADINEMLVEVDRATYTTSDPEVILQAVQNGLCGEHTGSIALGFEDEESDRAKADHAARLARIVASQTKASIGDAGARGVRDLSANAQAGREEKAVSRDTTTSDRTLPKVRGEGQ